MPTLNEEASVEHLICEWLKIPNVHLLFVDDDSTDRTVEIINQHESFSRRVFLLSRKLPRSYASSLIEGFAWGLKREYEFFCHIDCDSTQDPQFFSRMLSEVKLGKAVIGSRWVDGGGIEKGAEGRSYLSQIINSIFRVCIGVKVSDATHSFRLFNREVAEYLSRQVYVSNHFFSLVEMMNLVCKFTVVVEIPIHARKRHAGKSSVNLKVARRYFLDFFKYSRSYWKKKIFNALSLDSKLHKHQGHQKNEN